MTNRRKIMEATKAAGYEVKSLTFERVRDCAYGESWDASYWCLETECGEMFCSDKYDKDIAEGIDIMIQEIIQESNKGIARK